jgi:TonB family protein
MAGKNKNKQKELTRFLRYTGKKMSDSEKNAFERELQKDPFSEEAEEGLEGIPNESVIRDLRILKNKIQSGRHKRRIYLYRIAASVAVLLSISTLLLIFKHTRPEALVSENKTVSQIEITKSPPLSEPTKSPEEKNIKDVELKVAAPKKNTEKVAQSDKQLFQIKAKPIMSDTVSKVSGAVIVSFAENTRPIEARPEAARLTTRSESNQTVGYGTQKKTNNEMIMAADTIIIENNSGRTNYTPPMPAGGKESFDKYIEKNISRPAGTKPGRAVVVISFTVKTSGVLENLRIIRSPGKEFSDEALRLIKEGPAWIPAEEDNRKIDDEVRIRIVFK